MPVAFEQGLSVAYLILHVVQSVGFSQTFESRPSGRLIATYGRSPYLLDIAFGAGLWMNVGYSGHRIG